MPPKKAKDESAEVPRFGRVGNNLKMGIVGLPNVGKSSLFNLLSESAQADAENYPFCTIDPNHSPAAPSLTNDTKASATYGNLPPCTQPTFTS